MNREEEKMDQWDLKTCPTGRILVLGEGEVTQAYGTSLGEQLEWTLLRRSSQPTMTPFPAPHQVFRAP